MRYCKSHVVIVRKYIDEKHCIEDFCKKVVSTDEDLVIVKILNNKLTRQGNFCEVSLLYRNFILVKAKIMSKLILSSKIYLCIISYGLPTQVGFQV